MTAVDGTARSPGTLALDFGALLVIVRPEHEVAVSEFGGREPIACAALIAVDAVICPVRRPTLKRLNVEASKAIAEWSECHGGVGCERGAS